MTLTNNQTRKLVTLGILSALGTVLMIFEFPYFVPGLFLDLSDVVVLIVFMMYGWKEAALVGALKAILHFITKSAVGPLAIGQITAFLASMSYVLGMYLAMKKFKLNKYIAGIVTLILVVFLMTVANYFFVTPIWFGQYWYTQVKDWANLASWGLSGGDGYLRMILVIYVPFNLVKGSMIIAAFLAVYTILQGYIADFVAE